MPEPGHSFLITGHRNSIAFRLGAAGLGVVLATIGVFVTLWMASLQHSLEAATEESQFAAAKWLAADLQNRVQLRLRVLANASTHLDISRLDDAAYVERVLSERNTTREFFPDGILAITPSGRIVADLPPVPGRRNANVADREYFNRPLTTGQPFVGAPIMGRATRLPVLNLAVPVKDGNGQVRAILVGVTSLAKGEFLGLVGQSLRLGYSEISLITMRGGVFIASTDPDRILTALPAPGPGSEVADRIRAGTQGSARMTSSRGVEKLYALVMVPDTDWMLVLATPVATTFAPLQRLNRQALWVGLAVAVLALLSIALLTRKVAAPLVAAADRLDRITRTGGPLPELPEVGYEEIRQLFAGFNRLNRAVTAQSEARAESEARFRLLFDLAPVALSTSDREHRIVLMNRAFVALFGYTPQDTPTVQAWRERALAGEAVREAHEADWRQKWQASGSEGVAGEQEVVCKDGSRKTVLVTRIRLGDDMMLAAVDITSLRKSEEAMRLRNEELERFNEASVERELRMIELKRQVNDLAMELGRAAPHDLSFSETGETQP